MQFVSIKRRKLRLAILEFQACLKSFPKRPKFGTIIKTLVLEIKGLTPPLQVSQLCHAFSLPKRPKCEEPVRHSKRFRSKPAFRDSKSTIEGTARSCRVVPIFASSKVRRIKLSKNDRFSSTKNGAVFYHDSTDATISYLRDSRHLELE